MTVTRASFWTAAAGMAWLAVSATGLASEPRGLGSDTRWREPLARAEASLVRGDARAAEQAWQEAHRAVIRAGMPAAVLEVGRAYLRVGEAARDRQTAVARARQIFLLALVQARERRDAEVAAAAGGAFATLGDREAADRAFAAAVTLAAQNGDERMRERIALLRQQSMTLRPGP